MNLSRRSSILLVTGLCAVAIAWCFRQYVISSRSIPKPQSAPRHDIAIDSSLLAPAPVVQTEVSRLEARVALHPDDVKARQALFLSYQKSGQVNKAMEQLEAIARLQPANRNAALTLANAHLALKAWPQAEQAFQAMTVRWPKDYAGWQGLAAARYHRGHFQEAAMTAQKADALKPDNPGNRLVLASSLLEYAMQYPQPQLHTAALEWARREFDKLTGIWPKAGGIYLSLGRICLATRDFTAATGYLEKATQLLPKRSDAPLYLAKAYTSSRNTRAARSVLEKALASHPDSADLYDALGQLVQSSGEPTADQQALTLFQKAVQLAPKNGRFQERLGVACLRTNQVDDARRAFEMAVQLNPNRAFPVQQLASVYGRLHDTARATAAAKQSEILNYNAQQLSHLEAMVNTHPDSIPLHSSLADRYRFLGETGAARSEYLSLLRLDPGSAHAKEGLAAIGARKAAPVTALMPGMP